MNFEEGDSEWDGLDALLAAKPIDLNGMRDSEYFGQRMSFYMSPPKEAPGKGMPFPKTDKIPNPNFNKENRVNNAFAAKPTEAVKPTSKFLNESDPLSSYSLSNYSSSSSSLSSFSSGSSLSSSSKPPLPTTKESTPDYSSIPTSSSSIPSSVPSSSSSSLSSSIPKASNLIKPRAKTSVLSTHPTPLSSSSSSSFSSSSIPSVPSTPLSNPAPPTPSSSSSVKSLKSMSSPAASGIPSKSSIPQYSDLSTPARTPLSSSQETKPSMEDMLKRISRLEEENKKLRETVDQSDREKRVLSQKVTSLEEELHTFMREVQLVLLSR